MSLVFISLNKIVEFNKTYFDDKQYVLSHKPFRNNLLMFKNDGKHKKTYIKLEQKLSSFLLNDPVANRYIRYDGNQMITSDIEIVKILPYKLRMSSKDKFMKRHIPYAFADNKKSMMRLLKNYLIMEDPFEYEMYSKFKDIEWENGMYFEMYED